MAAAPKHVAEVIELYPQGPVKSRHGDTEFTTNPDGSEVVSLFGPRESQLSLADVELGADTEGFTANLADRFTPSQRYGLAQKLIEYSRVDLESRKDWEALTNTALRLLGIDKADASQLPFPGAAAMQHPVLAEACVRFQSNAIEEFFPATGPVKGSLAGEANEESQAQVQRAEDFMNFYLTAEDPDYYADSDQMLFYLPIVGSVFRKVWVDPRDGLPRARYVKAEDFIAPYFARDLKNCPRYAHRYPLTGAEIRDAMVRGEFIPIDLPEPSAMGDEGEGRSIEDRSDRRQRVLHEDDELYTILEYHVQLSLPEGIDEFDDGSRELHYIVTVDATSQDVLAVRRNWRENDETFAKRIWFSHYKLFPGLGFYGWGFLHVIGQLCESISGGVRAQLDSALLATVQGGFRAKDGIKKGGSVSIQPGRWQDVDATIEELGKTFYTPPFKEPSPALTALIAALIQDARKFASITEVVTGAADNKGPVGTTVALIEQSMKLFTAIHKRIFAAAREEFRMIAELLHDFGPYDEYPYFLAGEAKQALRSDFDDRVDFIPVADPNIISSVQRISMAQAVLELIKLDPQLYGPEERVEAHRRFLRALKVPDYEKLTPKLPKATYLDPIGENALAMLGKMIRAFPGQHHELHSLAHARQLEIARNTLPADQFQAIYTVLMAHIREHQVLQMMEQVSAGMQKSIGAPLPPLDIYGQAEDMPPELEMAVTMAAVQQLPPVPAPQPNSAGAEAQAKQQATADQEAKDAETVANIERETAVFQAKQKQSELDHQQELRHAEERHRSEMERMDEKAAAEILRANANARTRLQAESARDREKLRMQREAAKTGKRKKEAA